jgi:uncharacterized protein (TIGR00290 family)
MFQIPGTHLVEHQASIARVPWVQVSTPGVQEEEISDLESVLATLEIDGIVSGALRSDYQKSRLERMSERLGIRSWTPLWHQSSLEHMRGLVSNGFEVMLTSVSCEGLNASWLGTVLTMNRLQYWSKKRSSIDSTSTVKGANTRPWSLVVLICLDGWKSKVKSYGKEHEEPLSSRK